MPKKTLFCVSMKVWKMPLEPWTRRTRASVLRSVSQHIRTYAGRKNRCIHHENRRCKRGGEPRASCEFLLRKESALWAWASRGECDERQQTT
eukprot:938598-Rhodomonas_salina.1